MGETRKSFLLRMPSDLWEQVNRLAQADLRSVNAEIEFLLREAVRKRGVGESKAEDHTTETPSTAGRQRRGEGDGER